MQTTSLEAYESMDEFKETVRERVRDLLTQYGPLTDEMLCARYHTAFGPNTRDSSIRTRRCELNAQPRGRQRTTTGRWAFVWGLSNGE